MFYTDGLTEARRPTTRLFGVDRLCDLLARLRHLPLADILRGTWDEIDAFREGRRRPTTRRSSWRGSRERTRDGAQRRRTMIANDQIQPATLNVFRYVEGEDALRVIIGDSAPAGAAELIELAIRRHGSARLHLPYGLPR